MKYKRLYVAATSQHIGKTTSTLGLVYTLRKNGYNVGYCKPLGQEFVDLGDIRADKDALLFSRFMGFQLDATIHSPIIFGPGATADYLDNPKPEEFRNRIFNAAKVLEESHEMVVFEGTGHPGVGSVVNLSNADVAKMLNAAVVMVVKGGIGNTIDRLNLSLSLFREQNVPIAGVIVNKVMPDKMEKVRYYIEKKLADYGIPLMGLIPFDQTLSNPVMYAVKEAINGSVLLNGEYLDNPVEEIIAGSLVDYSELKQFHNLLLVVSSNRLEEAIHKVKEITERAGDIVKCPLSGIIITNNKNYSDWCGDYIKENRIPLIHTHLDTFGSVVKVSRIEVKINTRTPWKVKKATELIEQNLDLNIIL